MERTFVALKPDAVQRGLIGEIVQRFERRGYKIIGLKLVHLDRETAEKHYAEHVGKPFFEDLVKFITSGPIVAMAIKGTNIVEVSRKMIGATNPSKADIGTIRSDFAQVMDKNIIHGSDSVESAERELKIHFKDNELVPDWNLDITSWIL